MENNIINFTFEGCGVRIMEIDGEPWFVGKDVCDYFGDTNPMRSIGRVDDADKSYVPIVDRLGRTQNVTTLNESGLYALLFAMQPQKARKDGVSDVSPHKTVERLDKLHRFKRWVTSEVLPSIRKHGGYLTPEKVEEALLNPDVLIRLATDMKEERAKRIAAEEEKQKLALLNEAQAETIAVMKPKADYYDQILSSKDTMLATQIAKDYGMAAVAFNKMLNAMKIQYKAGNQWVLYQNYADHGYTRSETHVGGDGFRHWSRVQTKWTQEGRLFLYKILKKNGILPMCERDQETSK